MTGRDIIGWVGGGALSAAALVAALYVHRFVWMPHDCAGQAARCREAALRMVPIEPVGLAWPAMASLFLVAGLALLWLGGSRR